MTTRAPSRTNARAIASPRPRPAPVISAVFPSRRPDIASPVYNRAVVEDRIPSMQHFGGERVASAGGLVDLDGKPGGLGDLPKAVHHADWAAHDLGIPRNGANHFLLDHMVRR